MTLIPDAKIPIKQSLSLSRAIASWIKLIYIFFKLLFFPQPKNLSAEDLLLQMQQNFSGFEVNWRGYSYIRLFPFPFMEIVFVYFPPGSYTGVHCHDQAFNINKVILGELSDSLFRIRNGKPRLIKEQLYSQGQASVVMPFQSHEMKATTATISLNLHFPARGE
jgi:hypothetical protein